MKKFSEIVKELELKGVEIRVTKATLNGHRAYKVKAPDFNPAALWTAAEIKEAYQNAIF